MLKALLAVLVMYGSAAFATEDSYLIQGQIESGKIDLIVSEVQSSAQACDLLLQKLEYFPESQILSLNLIEVKNCPLDIYGKRKARVAWALPVYAQPKAPLRVQVNGNVLGEINFSTNEISQIHEGVNP